MNYELRERLTQMTLVKDTAEHPAILEQLRSEFGHSIEIVEGEHPIGRYTCAVHAFHLVEDPIYIEVATFGLGRSYAGPSFINFLIEHGYLTEIDLDHSGAGDLILYFERDDFRHIGRLITHQRVLSKWGFGHLYEHGIHEVPSTYGEDVRLYEGPNKEQCLELFIAYAESEGFTF